MSTTQQEKDHAVLVQALPTFDDLVKVQLKKFEEVVPKIEELQKEFMPLVITSVEDKTGYEAVQKALRLMVNKRTSVEAKRTELKADSLAYGKSVDEKAKEITKMLAPIEEHLRKQKERIDMEFENIKKKKIEETQALIRGRHDALVRVGMVLIGSEYVWTSKIDALLQETLATINLELMTPEDFDSFIQGILNMNANEYTAIEEDNKRREAAQKKIDDERKQLEQQQAELKKQQDELIQQRTQYRSSLLAAMGLGTLSFNDFWLYFPEGKTHLHKQMISYDEVKTMSNDTWIVALDEIKEKIQSYKEQALTEARVTFRSAQLKAAGLDLEYNFWCSRYNVEVHQLISSVLVQTLSDEEFNAKLEEIKVFVEQEKKEEAIKHKKMNRLSQLHSLGFTYVESNIGGSLFKGFSCSTTNKTSSLQISHDWVNDMIQSDDFDAELEKLTWRIKDLNQKELDAAVKEGIRLKEISDKAALDALQAGLSDKQKFDDYTARLLAVERPIMKTKKWSQQLDSLIRLIK